MKYNFLKTKDLLKRKILKFIIIYFIIILVTFLIDKNTFNSVPKEAYMNLLGLSRIQNLSILNISLKILQIALLIYTIIILYLDDIINSLEMIFPRVKEKKWYMNKTISISIFLIIFKILIYIFIGFLSQIFLNHFMFNINLFMLDIIVTLIIQNLILLIINVKYNLIFFILSITAFIVNIFVLLNKNIDDLRSSILLITFIVLFIINYFVFNVKKLLDSF
jgi:hypothetical protein